jgi:hypothetical protein
MTHEQSEGLQFWVWAVIIACIVLGFLLPQAFEEIRNDIHHAYGAKTGH